MEESIGYRWSIINYRGGLQMKKVLLSLLLTSFALVFGLQSVSAAGVNCDDFDTWTQAQTYFEESGGSPTNDIEGLDRDGDGLACETLPGAPDKATWSFETNRLLPGTTGGGTTGGGTTDGGTTGGGTTGGGTTGGGTTGGGTGGNAGGQLPNTATSNVTGIIAGAMTIMAGF